MKRYLRRLKALQRCCLKLKCRLAYGWEKIYHTVNKRYEKGKILTGGQSMEIIIVEKNMKPRHDEKGYVMMGVKEFLLDINSLEA